MMELDGTPRTMGRITCSSFVSISKACGEIGIKEGNYEVAIERESASYNQDVFNKLRKPQSGELFSDLNFVRAKSLNIVWLIN